MMNLLKPVLKFRGLLSIAIVAVVFISPITSADKGGPFPKYSSHYLSGGSVQVPQGLPGQWRLLIVAFDPKQQKSINTWFPSLTSLHQQVKTFEFYELPYVPTDYQKFRSPIEAFMKKTLPNPALQKRVIPLYAQKAGLMSLLKVTQENTIHLFLLGPDHRIQWREQGPYTLQKFEALKTALR